MLLYGARQVGKTFILLDFGEKNYENVVYINLETNRSVASVFENDIAPGRIITLLEAIVGEEIHPGRTLLFLDEIQSCERALTSLKYFCEQAPEYHIVSAGSLLGVAVNRQQYSFPVGKVKSLSLYPLDFEEFLWAVGNEMMMELIRDCYGNKRPLGQALHRKAMDLFRQYLIVGGMPQAVEAYVETGDFDEVDIVKRRILNLYREDIRKHAKGYEMKVEMIFDELPSQLKNQNRHFKLSSLKEGARFDEYKDAMFWLSDAMIVNHCYNATEPSLGLSLNRDRTLLKCYMGDTGLLISQVFDENEIVSERIYKKLLLDKLEVNMGMVVENMVAQMFVMSGHKLYFYSNSDRNDASSRMEIDFLLAKSKISSRHNISPIEVKSGKNYTLSSLRKFREKYKEQLYIPYVLHSGDLKEEDGIVYLPLYMASLL